MKIVGKKVQKFAVLAAVSGALLLTGCATVEENMAASKQRIWFPASS